MFFGFCDLVVVLLYCFVFCFVLLWSVFLILFGFDTCLFTVLCCLTLYLYDLISEFALLTVVVDNWDPVPANYNLNEPHRTFIPDEQDACSELPYAINFNLIGQTTNTITADRTMCWNYKGKPDQESTDKHKKKKSKENQNGKKKKEPKEINFTQSNMVNKLNTSKSILPTAQAIKKWITSIAAHQQSLINNTPGDFMNMIKSAYHMGPKPRNMNHKEHISRLAIEALKAMDLTYRPIANRHSTLNLIAKMTEGDYMTNLMKRHILPHITSAAVTYVIFLFGYVQV